MSMQSWSRRLIYMVSPVGFLLHRTVIPSESGPPDGSQFLCFYFFPDLEECLIHSRSSMILAELLYFRPYVE